MKPVIKHIAFLLPLLLITACKVPYAPTPVASVTNYLVVEGVINTGNDSTHIKLSRTLNLASSLNLKAELKAVVTIESNQNTTYPLTELGNGNYACAALNLGNANQYRIRIKTSDGRTYLSDFGATKDSRPIDSVTWKATSNGLDIYASTHDASNATRYYRWDYLEEWHFESDFQSEYVSDGLNIAARTPAQQVYDCYTGDESSNIILGSTSKLSQDVVSDQPIAIIAQTDQRISIRYSILVRQYALTVDAYNYWTQLKKNTEQLGSIFDAQPSATVGNIHCLTNPSEPVIGYITAGAVTSQRIFIDRIQLPNWPNAPFYSSCAVPDSIFCCDNTKKPNENQFINFNSPKFFSPGSLLIPITPFVDPNGNASFAGGQFAGFLSAAPKCVDCTLRGSKTPPPYWK